MRDQLHLKARGGVAARRRVRQRVVRVEEAAARAVREVAARQLQRAPRGARGRAARLRARARLVGRRGRRRRLVGGVVGAGGGVDGRDRDDAGRSRGILANIRRRGRVRAAGVRLVGNARLLLLLALAVLLVGALAVVLVKAGGALEDAKGVGVRLAVVGERDGADGDTESLQAAPRRRAREPERRRAGAHAILSVGCCQRRGDRRQQQQQHRQQHRRQQQQQRRPSPHRRGAP